MTATTPAALRAVLAPSIQPLLCVVVVASAIKAPLGLPLYFNAGLLLLGLFSAIALMTLDLLLLWLIGLIGVGLLSAYEAQSLATSGPRLAQLLLIVFATELIRQLEPRLLARFLLFLLPLMLLVALAESLLPEPLFSRRLFGTYDLPRHAGLHGEPNYNAILYGVVGAILAQHRPQVMGVLTFAIALLSASRALAAALVAWLAALTLGRTLRWTVLLVVVVILVQPALIVGFDSLIDEPTRNALIQLSSNRYLIWTAHATAGFDQPLGVGYFGGERIAVDYAGLPPQHAGKQAHSLFLQVFGEFGWVGYLFFAGFLVQLTRRITRYAPDQLPLLVLLLTGYAFVNGLSDWAFWFTIGYMLACAREGRRDRPA